MTKKRKKKSKKRRSRSTAAVNLKAVIPFLPFAAPPLITAVIYMWLYTSMNIASIPTRELREHKAKLIKENDSIRLRIQELQAPARIEPIARNKLGMISPQEYRLVALDEPILPPESLFAGPRPAESILEASKGSEGLFGFLNNEYLNKRGDFAGASQEATPVEAARQSG